MKFCKPMWAALVAVWVALCLNSAALAQSHSGHASPKNSKPYRPDSLVLEMLDELEDQADAAQRTGENIILGPGLARNKGDDLWSSVLQVTRVDNPFITRQCRLDAVNNAQSSIGGIEKAKEHAHPHAEEWKEVLQGERRISLTEYLDHILDCKEFCAPLVGSLLKCHIQGVGGQVSRGDSLVLTFGVGIPRAGEKFEFSPRELAQIEAFARSMRSKRKKVVIEARASILNETESLRKNLELSQRRGSLMSAALVEAGFPEAYILVKSLCWEPPRLAIEEVAAAYGFTSVRNSLPTPQYMDQSVVLLGYDPDR